MQRDIVMRKNAAKTSLGGFLSFWIAFFLLKPPIWNYIRYGDLFFRGGWFLSLFFVLCICLVRKCRVSFITVLVLGYSVWTVITAALREPVSAFLLMQCGSFLLFSLLFDSYAGNLRPVISALMVNFELLIYTNFVALLIGRNYVKQMSGYELSAILGGDNGLILYCLPACCIAVAYYEFTRKKMRCGLLIAVACATCFLVWSATAVCGIVIFLLLLLWRGKKHALTFRTVFIVSMIAQVIIQSFQYLKPLPIISSLIVNVLGKDVTFSQRTYVWAAAWHLVAGNPFFGCGYGVTFFAPVGSTGFYAFHAHNQFLQQLLIGGVPQLLLYLFLNCRAGATLDKIPAGNLRKNLLAVFGGLYTIFLAESYFSVVLFLIFFVAFHSKQIAEEAEPHSGAAMEVEARLK